MASGGQSRSEREDGPAASTRLLTMQFAAHLARLLDGQTDPVTVSPLRLRHTLTFTLAKPKYAERLVGYPNMAFASSPDAAAGRWLECVLDRRQQLARALDRHKAHELFEAMCRRGLAPGWPEVRLDRGPPPPGPAITPPEDWLAIGDRLGRVDPSISKGNPAEGTRATLGSLKLVAGAAHHEVAEELSVWQAATCGPLRLQSTGSKEGQRAFYSQVTKALEAAAAHWSAMIAIGLWPPDWLEAVSVNTAKKLAAFLAEVRRLSVGADVGLAHWERAWGERQVPGHVSATALYHSEVGQAIRRRRGPPVAIDPDTFDDPEGSDEPQVLEDLELEQRLEIAVSKGVIDDLELSLILRLATGESLAELKSRPDVQMRIGVDGDLHAWLVDVAGRIDKAARKEP